MCSPEVSFCISKTIVSDSSELNTVKQGREEWRSKCSKISVGRKRSRQNFFFPQIQNVSMTFFFLIEISQSYSTLPYHSVADYWKPFPRGLGCCLRGSLLFVCSVLKELWRYIHKQWGEELGVKRVYWISTFNDAVPIKRKTIVTFQNTTYVRIFPGAGRAKKVVNYPPT